MLTFNDLVDRYKSMTGDDSTANETFGKSLINETQKYVCSLHNWSFLEGTLTRTSTASQDSIQLPADYHKLINFKITVGSTEYTPIEVSSYDEWNAIVRQTQTSNYSLYFHIRNGRIYVYPTISDASLSIELQYLKMPVDMEEDDYTTGNITDIANNATTVTGSGTTWTGKAGQYIKMPDNVWYKIDSVTSATELELDRPYQGSTLSGGSESYTIGELPIIPEPYHDLLWTRPVGIYHLRQNNNELADRFYSNRKRLPGMFEKQLDEMRRVYSIKTTQNVKRPTRGKSVLNINNYPEDIG